MHWPMKALLLLALVAAWPVFCRAADTPHAQWEREIAAFEAADKTNPPPTGAILFVGSSSIRLWKSLAEDFKGIPVINRGFGGSQMADSVFYADRIVLPYRPRQIVVYAGDNDLAAGKTPHAVLSDFQALVAKVHGALPETRICFLSIKPSPARWTLVERMREANRLIAEYARATNGLAFIDVFTPMLGEDGQPRPELFAADKLHLNETGYRLWSSTVRPYLLR
jgi:lysophospholipase L1-like esterase